MREHALCRPKLVHRKPAFPPPLEACFALGVSCCPQSLVAAPLSFPSLPGSSSRSLSSPEPVVAGNVFAYCRAICSCYHPGFRFGGTNDHRSTDFSGLLFVCIPATSLSTTRTSVLKAYLTPVFVCVCIDAWGDLH